MTNKPNNWEEELRKITEDEKKGLEFSKAGSDLWDELHQFIQQTLQSEKEEIVRQYNEIEKRYSDYEEQLYFKDKYINNLMMK